MGHIFANDERMNLIDVKGQGLWQYEVMWNLVLCFDLSLFDYKQNLKQALYY